VEGKRASRKSRSSMDAFDCCMRAMWHFAQQTPADYDEAANLARKAISLDQSYAQGHMVLARTLNSRLWYGSSNDFSANLEASTACRSMLISVAAAIPSHSN
jgi:adenylate cyclase